MTIKHNIVTPVQRYHQSDSFLNQKAWKKMILLLSAERVTQATDWLVTIYGYFNVQRFCNIMDI